MLTFPRYESYKDSGVEWLGEVPSHWTPRRMKSFALVKRGASPRPITDSRYFDDHGEYGWVRIEDVTRSNKYLLETTQYLSPLGASCSIKQYEGDLFLSIAGSVGKPIISKIKCCIHDGFVWFDWFNEINRDFLFYIFLTGLPFIGLGKHGTQLNLNTATIGDIRIPVPYLEEQKQIVEFLDRTTTDIDCAINQKQRLIELLQEQKNNLINQAVTKGLNPNAPMRDSEVRWIGEIPEHWEIWRSKRLFSQRKEYAQPDDIQLSATQAYGVIPQEEYEQRIGRKVTKILQHLEKRRHVEIGDFVISMRSFEGGLERAWAKGCIRSSYVVLKPSEQVDVDFFSYVFKSSLYISALQSTAIFIRDGQDLNFDNFCAVDLALPPIEEQRAIAQALNAAVANNSKISERIKKEVDLLQEFRQILVANAVTGKIKV